MKQDGATKEGLRGVGNKQAKEILAGRLNEVNAINNELHLMALADAARYGICRFCFRTVETLSEEQAD
jgi:hypothetical protein